MNKFNIGDIVGTNIEYMQGFEKGVVSAPSGLVRLQGLEVIKIDELPDLRENTSNYFKPYLYTCKGKTKTYQLNECFLEQLNE